MADTRVKYLRRLLDEAKRYRKDKYDDEWNESLKWLKGDQYLRGGDSDADFRSDTVTNFLFAHMMDTVPHLSNRLPIVTALPYAPGPENKAKADELTALLARCLRYNDFVTRQTESTTNGLIFGRGIYKPVWNGSMRGGTGDIQITTTDPRSIYKDRYWLKESNWIFECRELDKLTLYRMYPNKKSVIDKAFAITNEAGAPDSYGVQGANTGETTMHATSEGEDPTTSEAYVWDVAAGMGTQKSKCEVVEAWFVDESTVEDVIKIQKSKPGGGESTSRKKAFKKKYPMGRLITFIGNEALDDRPNPFPHFPYVEWDNYIIPGETYGHGDLVQLKEIQEQYNIRSNQIYDGLNFTTFPITFYDYRSGLDPDEIENRPGGYYPVEDVDGIRRFDTTGMSAATFTSLKQIEHVFDIISGSHDVTRGEVPGDVRSGYAVEQLQEMAQNRLRLKTRSLEYAVKNLAKYMTDMIGMFYIPGVHYQDTMDLTGIDSDMFDFEVRAGTSLPQSRFATMQREQWMFGEGIVDEKYILENSDVEGKEEVTQRMQPLWDAKRNMMLQGPQGPPPPGGGPAPEGM